MSKTVYMFTAKSKLGNVKHLKRVFIYFCRFSLYGYIYSYYLQYNRMQVVGLLFVKWINVELNRPAFFAIFCMK